MIWKVPQIWRSERCFILGGGASLARQFNVPDDIIQSVLSKKLSPTAYLPYMDSLKNEHVIGVNMSFLFEPYLDFVFFGDQNFWQWNKSALGHCKVPIITCHENVEEVKQLKRNKRKRNGITIDDSTMISWNGNSGAACINFAYHLGVRQIILLGFDMNLGTINSQHWHKAYPSSPKDVQNTFISHLKCFSFIANDAKLLGLEILNANPDSAIENFKKINLKDVL